jgi:hypothetical protein
VFSEKGVERAMQTGGPDEAFQLSTASRNAARFQAFPMLLKIELFTLYWQALDGIFSLSPLGRSRAAGHNGPFLPQPLETHR